MQGSHQHFEREARGHLDDEVREEVDDKAAQGHGDEVGPVQQQVAVVPCTSRRRRRKHEGAGERVLGEWTVQSNGANQWRHVCVSVVLVLGALRSYLF